MSKHAPAVQRSYRQTHALKVWPEYYIRILAGVKTFEIRKDDRGGFHVGDILLLREWDPKTEEYTGLYCSRVVTYVLPGGQFGLAEGYVAMAIAP